MSDKPVIPDELKHFLSSIKPRDTTKVLLLRGAPGSGKSTLAKEIMENYLNAGVNVSHLEADMFFIDMDGKYQWNPEQLRDAHEWCFTGFICDSRSNVYELVIVSNTFTREKEIKPYREHCIKNHIEFMEYTCTGEYQNVHGVPEGKVKAMRQRLQQGV